MQSAKLKELFENFGLTDGDEWITRINRIIADQPSALHFADGAKTMAHLYFSQSRKTDAKLLKVAALFALASGLAYLDAHRMVAAVGMATWLRDEFPNHQATRALNTLLTTRRPAAVTIVGATGAPGLAPDTQVKAAGLEATGFYLELFDGVPADEVARLLKDVRLKKAAIGETILKVGDKPDRFYIIVSGAVAVTLESGLMIVLKEQDFFGEISMLLGQKEIRAIVTATEDVELLEFSKLQLVEAFIQFPNLEQRILRFAFLRAFWNLANQIDGLKKYKREELVEFFDSFVPTRFKNGEVLFNRLSQASGLYLIIEGRVQIRDDDREVANLGPGEFIGEMSLLEYGQHIAQAVATTPGHALVCPPEKFQATMKKFPRFFQFLKDLSAKRKKELQLVQLSG